MNKSNMKKLCDCGKVAVWCYLPGYSEGGNSYSCEDCVNRGCECNHNYIDDDPSLPDGEEGKDWKWIEKEKSWTYIDEQGREYPCCEYSYNEDGFDKTDTTSDILMKMYVEYINKTKDTND
jgi:hypothetical protein